MQDLKESDNFRSYILGDIDESERAVIEERLLDDAAYFEKLTMAEEELVQQYVDENLSAPDREKFEVCFLRLDENRERVRFARALRKYVDEANPVTPTEPSSASKSGFIEALKAFFLSPVPVAGALLIVLGVSGWLIWSNFSNRSEVLTALNKAYRTERPIQSRITDLEYAPMKNTRGADEEKSGKIDRELAKTIALRDASENPTAENLHALGRVYLAEKNFKDALEQFERAVRLAPENAKLHSDYGAALMEYGRTLDEGRLENLARANEEFAKAIELDKNLLDAHFNQALCLQALNLPNQAKEAWRKYLELDSASKWAEEARRNLELIETDKPLSKTKEQVLQEFLDAKQTGDHEKAWRTLSRNREMITGKLIPQQLAFLFVDAKSIGETAKAGEYLEALIYVGNLEKQRSGDSYWKDIARFYSDISDDKIQDLKQAQDLVRQGYRLYIEGNLEKFLENLNSAKEILIKTGNFAEAELCNYWIANCLYQFNKVKESIDVYQNLLEFSQNNNYKWLATQTFVRLGYQVGAAEKKFSKSVEYGNKALILANETEDLYNQQRIYSLIAENYRRVARYNLSMNFSEKSLVINQLPESSHRQMWLDYETITETLFAIKFYKTAANFQKEALHLSRKIKDVYFEQLSNVYLGMIYTSLGNYNEAESFIQEGKKLVEEFEDKQSQAKQLAYCNLIDAHLKRISGKCPEALNLYQKLNEFHDSSEFQLSNYDSRKGQLLCYLEMKDDSASKQQFPIILSIFNEYRKEILEEQNRNSFFDNEQDIYDLAIEYEFNQANYETAFDYSEESRSRSLLDLMHSKVRISDSQEQMEVTLSSAISEPLKLAAIRSRMPEQVQIVQYAVLKNKVLIWLITKKHLTTAEVEISSENLEASTNYYLNLLAQADEANLENERQLAIKFYETLIDPVEANLDPTKEICLIPDKSLFQLPFATFISPKTGKYLISDYSLFYAPSANVFLLSTKTAQDRENIFDETFLSVGNPDFNRRLFKNLSELPSAEREAKQISDFYPNSIRLIGRDATKDKVKENLLKTSIVHFAGHYLIDEQSPLLSGLVLTTSGQSNERKETILANHEILSNKLSRTKLIVLSACRTGIEDVYNGEGVIGSARTFLAMKVPLIVASQWAVDSEATAELMINFHRYRKTEKLSTVAALRKTQLEMLASESGKFRHPYFWSGFIILGGYSKF